MTRPTIATDGPALITKAEWARARGLTESKRTGMECLHWLAVGRCAVARCFGLRNDRRDLGDWLDHVTCWVRPGYRLILSQPYPLSTGDLSQLIECERLARELAPTGAVHAAVTADGWYGFATTAVYLSWSAGD